MVDLLNNNFVTELKEGTDAFNRWVDKQVNWITTSDSSFERIMEECESTLAALQQSEIDLEEKRVQIDKVKTRQKFEKEKRLRELEVVQLQKRQLLPELNAIKIEETKTNEKHMTLKEEKNRLEREMEATMNELTRGFRNFLYLGLEFHKADNDCMKFIFTLIDPDDPLRQFYFLLLVDSSDQYQLIETSPKLDEQLTKRFLLSLNNDNNIGNFVVKMRQAFQNTI